ncbi:MAG: hypothetical protein FJX68_12120 [Alphaproteobacteria bacterium]|nr:hypothetical protein [Alphaproteobacteria bacterium]
MTPERLRQIVAAHGGQPARWPVAEREAGLALARQLPEANAWLEAAGRLDSLLDDWPVRPAEPALRARILTAIAERPADVPFWSWLVSQWPAPLRAATMSGFAAAAVLGLLLGLGEPAEVANDRADLAALWQEIEEGDLEL